LAIYRFEAKIISRRGSGNGSGGAGRSTVGAASYRTGRCATSAAAYRAGAVLTDERSGQRYDYSAKRGVLGAEIILPANAPAWMADRAKLWNAIEHIETRKDAQLARDFIFSLPHELPFATHRAMMREFVETRFAAEGYVGDIAWHGPHRGDKAEGLGLNHHAHVMVTLRKVEGPGFARLKQRPPAGQHPATAWKAELLDLRQAWEILVNRYLAEAGLDVRVDRRSLKDRGIDRMPQAKRGPLGAVADAAASIQPAAASKPSGAPPCGVAAPGNGEPARASLPAIERGAPDSAQDEQRRQWSEAAQTQTARISGQPPPRRKAGSGKGGGRLPVRVGNRRQQLAAADLVEDYLRLCRDPARDLDKWLAGDKRNRGKVTPRAPPAATREQDERQSNLPVAHRQRLRGQTLPVVQDRLDPDRQGWRDYHGLPARHGAGIGRYDRLRQVRAEGRSARVAPAPGDAAPPALQYQHQRQHWHRATAAGRARAAPVLPAMAVKAGWPDDMKRELAACRTSGDYLAWERKWADRLAGRVVEVGPHFKFKLRKFNPLTFYKL
jgi:hypothetical protein